MAVYVDPLRDYGWRLGPSCHCYADQEDELHALARRIGMKRSWFQPDEGRLPHYDLTASRRAAALRAGAVEVTTEQMWEHIKARVAAARGRTSFAML